MEETFPSLLFRNYQKYGHLRVDMRRKSLGIWHRYTWADFYEKVKYFSLGLITIGFEPNDKLAIIGYDDPEWYWAEIAAQSARGLAVGMFIGGMLTKSKVNHYSQKYSYPSDGDFVRDTQYAT